MGIHNIGGDHRRGYTLAGDFVELGASCTNCGRAVEPQDISTDFDANATRVLVICPSCHGTVINTSIAGPDPEDDTAGAVS
jgi:NAD-dependent SIR2 family protein deacetylase